MCKEELPPKEPEMCKEEQQLPPDVVPKGPESKDEEMPKEEVEKQDEEEKGVGLAMLIDMTTKSILQIEMAEIASSLVDYRKNLGNRMLADEEEEDLFDKTVQYGGIATGITEGWKVWKAGGFDRKKTSYEAFKQYIKLEEP